MRVIDAADLGSRIEELCLEASTVLPGDVLAALEGARASERSPRARGAIDVILENARIAREERVPLCQDTGVFSVHLFLGRDTCVSGDLAGQAAEAVRRASCLGSFRSSVVGDPAGARRNTGDNTPPLLEVVPGDGDATRLAVMAKGGGSEAASRQAMLPPNSGFEGVFRFVEQAVEVAGAGSCPPLVLGVGIGGSFERSAVLAKRALLRPLDAGADDPGAALREEELVERINRLGIGAGALGGTVTCMGAQILTEPCHIANLPVALSMNCHALRRAAVEV